MHVRSLRGDCEWFHSPVHTMSFGSTTVTLVLRPSSLRLILSTHPDMKAMRWRVHVTSGYADRVSHKKPADTRADSADGNCICGYTNCFVTVRRLHLDCVQQLLDVSLEATGLCIFLQGVA